MLGKGFDLRATVEILNIEERIPKDHLLRKIDAAVDFNHKSVMGAVQRGQGA